MISFGNTKRSILIPKDEMKTVLPTGVLAAETSMTETTVLRIEIRSAVHRGRSVRASFTTMKAAITMTETIARARPTASEESVRKARKINKSEIGRRCRIEQGSVEKMPFQDESFDLVTAFETVFF